MKQAVEIILQPGTERDFEEIKQAAARKLRLPAESISAVRQIRLSLDARPRDPVYRLQCEVFVGEALPAEVQIFEYRHVENAPPVHIVGFGPAGMFAALRLLELGFKPVIYERGKNVRDRRFDLRAIQQFNLVNPNSNYCFGEGGAGTYSDGKLYTRAAKRGEAARILKIFVDHGAAPEIMIDAHPHIGSNKLPHIVVAIRQTILDHGGEIHFNSKVTDIIVSDNNKLRAIVINDEQEIPVSALVVAAGHSARDVFTLLSRRNINIEAKAFAAGVRIEHPQELINSLQYHNSEKSSKLPPAVYSLVCQYRPDGVYSFCMCPGGIIVPASTAPGEIVLNGMSVSRRNSPFANSGLVVTVDHEDFAPYAKHGALAGMMYQSVIEQAAHQYAGGTLKAPAQRVTDFLARRPSATLPRSSYIPGLIPADIDSLLPEKIVEGLRFALREFDKKMRGYITEDAVMAAPETRTSSPVRVPRDKVTMMHVQVSGLFPAGEGAGYAGGIVSAAVDGEHCAEAAARWLSTASI